MPYKGEFANKTSHYDFVKNPDVSRFLEECDYLREPSDEEMEEMGKGFVEPLPLSEELPERVIAVDGSLYESSINDRLPSTKIGYVKIGTMLINMSEYRDLRVEEGKFVDPFRVAKLQESNSPLTFTLPSANIKWGGKDNVKDSFRAVVDESLSDQKTRMSENDFKTSLRSTLFLLASMRPEPMGTRDPNRLRLHRCPSCGLSAEEQVIEVHDIEGSQFCPRGCEIYPTDCLRIWEEISDYQSNSQALTRFMMLIEHLMPIHYIRYLAENSLATLASTAFFIDGPLAVFGNGAWMYGSILKYLTEINGKLRAIGQKEMIVIGLQKTGMVAEHCGLINKFLPSNRVFPITDEYRYKYILGGREAAQSGFGDETYYGQDFIYKTPSGRIFVLGIPFPVQSKRPLAQFLEKKVKVEFYPTLGRALALINHFESDLYDNAVVPVALAHKYTAISLRPGGRVLDVLTRRGLETK